jgi:hypothetical protein
MPRARVCSNGRPYTRKPLELFPWEIQEDDDSPRHHIAIAIAIANSIEWPFSSSRFLCASAHWYML